MEFACRIILAPDHFRIIIFNGNGVIESIGRRCVYTLQPEHAAVDDLLGTSQRLFIITVRIGSGHTYHTILQV